MKKTECNFKIASRYKLLASAARRVVNESARVAQPQDVPAVL